MKLVLLSLFTLTSMAQAGLVLEVAPQEPATANTRIDVPAPKDSATTKDKVAPLGDVLRFANKDTLHGQLLGYDVESGIRWQSPETKEPITFGIGSIIEIKLEPHKSAKQPEAKATQAVGLTNDDELPGTIVSLNEKTLVLDTWYAGKLSIPRAMLKRITPLSTAATTIYEGPTGLEGWLGGRGGNRKGWTYRDGALVSTNYGTIGRDVKLPPIASVEFDMTYRGNSQISVCLYSEKMDNISNCYMLQMNANYFSLQRYSRDGGSNNVGEPVQLSNAVRREKTHIDLRVNKETKSIWLLLDGRMIKQWTDPGEFAGTGTSLIFSGQAGTFVKITNIKVKKWDGRIEAARGTKETTTEDNIKLANQDKVSGKLKKIENGKAEFTSAYAELKIPLERMEELVFATEGAEVPKRTANDVRASFTDRGAVTMHLESWDDKHATVSSPAFGKATFLPAAFQRLQFNLDQQPTAEDDALDAVSDENQ